MLPHYPTLIRRFALVGFAAAMLSTIPGFSLARADDAVSMRMDWLPISYHAPFYLAIAKGYYRDVNIDFKIEDGKGSGTTIQLVANNTNTFGLADATVVAKAVAQGAPVKLILGVFRSTSAAIVFPGKNAIASPADLKGKKLATCPGDAPAILLPAYLKAVKLDPSDIQVVNVDCSAKYTVAAQGLADATLGFGPYGITMFGTAGISDVRELDYVDAGLVVPSHGVIASLQTIKEKPDLVRRFVAATSKAWNEARQHPDEAIAAMVERVPLMHGQEKVLSKEFAGYVKYLDTPNTAGKPFGWQSPEDWAITQSILVQYMGMTAPASTEVFYTNDFVPK
jgi:NitT/TauT family transport system substrate-binding protein